MFSLGYKLYRVCQCVGRLQGQQDCAPVGRECGGEESAWVRLRGGGSGRAWDEGHIPLH